MCSHPLAKGPPLACALIAASDGPAGEELHMEIDTVCPLVKSTTSEAWNLCGCPPSASRSGCPLPGLGVGPCPLGLGPAAWTRVASQSSTQRLCRDTSGSLVLSFLCPCLSGISAQSAGLVGHMSLSLSVPTLLTRPWAIYKRTRVWESS